MARKILNFDEPILNYISDVSLREAIVLKELREETQRLESGNMQVTPEQGAVHGVSSETYRRI